MVFSEQDAFLDVAVLAGGDSPEREISIDSGRCVAEALRSRGHHVAIFDPSDVDEMAATIERLLDDPELRAELSARARSRSEGFSWTQTVTHTVDVIKAAAS